MYSVHFVSGSPNPLTFHTDYVPSILELKAKPDTPDLDRKKKIVGVLVKPSTSTGSPIQGTASMPNIAHPKVDVGASASSTSATEPIQGTTTMPALPAISGADDVTESPEPNPDFL